MTSSTLDFSDFAQRVARGIRSRSEEISGRPISPHSNRVTQILAMPSLLPSCEMPVARCLIAELLNESTSAEPSDGRDAPDGSR